MSKRIRLLMLALCAILVVSGLGMSSVHAQSPVVIKLWSIAVESDAASHAAVVNAVAAYNAAHTGKIEVDVTYIENQTFKTQLDVAVAGGQVPDIFQTWGGGLLQSYAASGVVREISTLKGDTAKKFIPGALAPGNFNGKLYAVPAALAGVFLWTNVDLLKANNAPLPTTWSNFLTDCKVLSAAGIIPVQVGNKQQWPGAFWYYYLVDRIGGSTAFSNAFNGVKGATFADPVFVQAGKDIQAAVDAGCFETGFNGNDYDQSLIGSGKAAMQLQGDWNLAGLRTVDKDLTNTSIKPLPFPAVEGGKGDPTDMVGGTNSAYAVSAKAPKEADDAVVAIFGSDSFGKDIAAASLMPALVGFDKDITDPIVAQESATLGKAAYVQLYYDQFLPPKLAQVFLQVDQDTFGEATTPEKAASDWAAAAKASAAPTAAATASN